MSANDAGRFIWACDWAPNIGAYQRLVYPQGGYVLHMLRSLMNLTGNKKMDWFFDEWVYGTEAPRYKFDYQIIPEADGKFRLKASLTESEVSDPFLMSVPIYFELDGARIFRLGTIVMQANSTNPNLDVVLPQKPKRVMINQNDDVLARNYEAEPHECEPGCDCFRRAGRIVCAGGL